jgi:hypothetical protein
VIRKFCKGPQVPPAPVRCAEGVSECVVFA